MPRRHFENMCPQCTVKAVASAEINENVTIYKIEIIKDGKDFACLAKDFVEC